MTPEDLDHLAGAEGKALLDAAADLDFSPAHRIASTAALRALDPVHAAAAIDVVLARRGARGRIRDGLDRPLAEMLLTEEAVQQATAWPVAAARAHRLRGRSVHDVTCSVGAELGELVRTCPEVVGTDLDPVRARMAAHNVPGARVEVADALTVSTGDAVVVADPARRSGGRRIHDPAALSPPLPALLDRCSGADHVVKCAPGLDVEQLDLAGGRGWRGEVEVVSLDGGVREACLWSPSLAGGVRRRATVLRAGADGEVSSEQVTDLDDDSAEPHPEADRFLVDPDGAVVRAGLVRHWAARHGLRQLDPRVAHLTGPHIPAGHSGFEVLERCRVDRRELRRVLRGRDCGSLEVLVRAVDIDPDSLRRSLALRGRTPLALVVTRIGTAGVAFVCGPRRRPD